jgi:hypothetical protein
MVGGIGSVNQSNYADYPPWVQTQGGFGDRRRLMLINRATRAINHRRSPILGSGLIGFAVNRNSAVSRITCRFVIAGAAIDAAVVGLTLGCGAAAAALIGGTALAIGFYRTLTARTAAPESGDGAFTSGCRAATAVLVGCATALHRSASTTLETTGESRRRDCDQTQTQNR